jgi:epoxyqueuosine reductase QueG
MNPSVATGSDSIKGIVEEIRSMAKEMGIDLIGFGRTSDIKDVQKIGADSFDFPSMISMAVQLPLEAVKEARDEPSIALRESYKVANKKMMGASKAIAEKLGAAGFQSRVVHPAERPDSENLKGPLSLKSVARNCGLGWIGKNGLLVTKDFGPRVRTITILTDMPFEDEVEKLSNGCGECRECIDNCALKVLKDQTFKDHPPSRDGTIDWVKCGRFETRLIGDGSVPEKACGKCIAYCPLSYPS